MPSNPILDALTAERLEELAKWHQEVADMMAAHEYIVDGYKAEATAAVLRAVAGAERAHVIIYPQTDEETGELEHWETRLPLRHGSKHVADSPTLLSALGAVGETR